MRTTPSTGPESRERRPPLHLVSKSQRETAETASVRPLLAIWPLTAAPPNALAVEPARLAVEQYSDPGDLVLIAGSPAALAEAVLLERRAFPLPAATRMGVGDECSSSAGAETAVRALAPVGDAALILAPVDADEPFTQATAARLAALLKPGGFLLLFAAQGAGARQPLGAIVRACQRSGLGYWQHVIALDARSVRPADGEGQGPRAECDGGACPGAPALGCRLDLLAFRKPAAAGAGSAALEQRRAA